MRQRRPARVVLRGAGDEEEPPPPGVPPAAPARREAAARRTRRWRSVAGRLGRTKTATGSICKPRRRELGRALTPPALAGGGGRAVSRCRAPAGTASARVPSTPTAPRPPTLEDCADTTPPTHRVSLLTLNLVGDDDAWDDGAGHEIPVPWRDRYDRVARWMQSTGTVPDILALQEVYAVKLGLWDYETLFVLMDRIRARTGRGRTGSRTSARAEATNTIRAGPRCSTTPPGCATPRRPSATWRTPTTIRSSR